MAGPNAQFGGLMRSTHSVPTRFAMLPVALSLVATSCGDRATGPSCENPFVGSLATSVVSDSRLAGCAKFYTEQPTNGPWVIEMREDGTDGQWLNVLHAAPGPPVGTRSLGTGSPFTVTISVRTPDFHHTFAATSGTITITEVSDRVRGRVVFTGHETTRGTDGTRTVSADVTFTAICTPTQFQSC